MRFGRAVEAHDEVVAAVVAELMLADRFGQEEGAPVCDTADDAAGVEDEGAGCAGDSLGGGKVSNGILRGGDW